MPAHARSLTFTRSRWCGWRNKDVACEAPARWTGPNVYPCLLYTSVPVVLLTALNRPDDIVHGFSLGADDYITKPFTFREVEVRLQAILRRMNWNLERVTQEQVIQVQDIVVNDDVHEVTVRGEVIHLTPIEYQLLRTLMNSPDKPVSKEDLFQSVWGYNIAGGTNLVEVAMRRLREKVELDPSSPIYLLTVRGVGYKFSTQGIPDKLTVRPVSYTHLDVYKRQVGGLA